MFRLLKNLIKSLVEVNQANISLVVLETRAALPLLSWITRDELYTTLSLKIRTKLVAHKITIALLNFVNIPSEMAVQVL